MVSIIAHHLGLLIAMWVVLVLVALTLLVKLVKTLRGGANISELAEAFTRPMLFEVIPLIVLSWLTTLDPSPFHIIIRIWYYLAALFIVLRNLMELGDVLQRK